MQFIILEMESYYQRAQEYEKKIIQQYIDKCKPFYGMYTESVLIIKTNFLII